MEERFRWIPQRKIFETTIYLARCGIDIQAKNGKWTKWGLKVDSGADTTMLELDDLYTLGYREDDCVKEYYDSANTVQTLAYGRQFNIKIGDISINDVPILFSVKPIANPLLGRAKIFETVNIIFDNQAKRTIFRS